MANINKNILSKPQNYIEKKCVYCGKSFRIHKTIENLAILRSKKNMGTRFCCRKCMFSYKKEHSKEFTKTKKGRDILSKKMRGNKNPFYNKGNRICADKYNYEFRPILRKQIREKFNNTCCLCGRHKQENEINFSCHHKDFDKKNNNINNFELLCSSCHQHKHMEYKKLMKKLN